MLGLFLDARFRNLAAALEHTSPQVLCCTPIGGMESKHLAWWDVGSLEATPKVASGSESRASLLSIAVSWTILKWCSGSSGSQVVVSATRGTPSSFHLERSAPCCQTGKRMVVSSRRLLNAETVSTVVRRLIILDVSLAIVIVVVRKYVLSFSVQIQRWAEGKTDKVRGSVNCRGQEWSRPCFLYEPGC